ncbi:MAG: hypothetical protein KBD15_03540 [Candidatus Magasanikbacteria bacterium]|nr:hypothetical protein [Candidatus Magasanikbacteria bacterium]
MFDDQLKGGGQSTVPPNLPIGEPEDMFSRTPDIDGDASPVPDMPSAPPLRTEDTPPPSMPASTPSALDAGILKPKEQMPIDDMNIDSGTEEPLQMADAAMPSSSPSFASSAGAPEAPINSPRIDAPYMPPQVSVPPPLPQDDMYRMKEPTLSRGIMTGIVMIIVLLIVGGGGWWIYRSFIAPAKTTTNNPFGQNTVVPPVTNTTVPPITEEAAGLNEPVSSDDIDTTVLFGEPIDSDGDGLDDTRESTLQTDPNNWDTDADELSDGDEVIIWKTNPLVADTDGDTYLDGAEVKAGYNPAGPGKIFEPPPASATTNSRLNENVTVSSSVDVAVPVSNSSTASSSTL